MSTSVLFVLALIAAAVVLANMSWRSITTVLTIFLLGLLGENPDPNQPESTTKGGDRMRTLGIVILAVATIAVYLAATARFIPLWGFRQDSTAGWIGVVIGLVPLYCLILVVKHRDTNDTIQLPYHNP
jgi:hypothetical protein